MKRTAWTAKRVRDLRARLGLTQAQLGERLNVRQATISDWEREKTAPTGAAVALLNMLDSEARVEDDARPD